MFIIIVFTKNEMMHFTGHFMFYCHTDRTKEQNRSSTSVGVMRCWISDKVENLKIFPSPSNHKFS